MLNKRLEHVMLRLSHVKARAAHVPILVDPLTLPDPARTVKTLSTGYVFCRLLGSPFSLLSFFSRSAHPVSPQGLASDIQQFIESKFAQQYFASWKLRRKQITSFIFKHRSRSGK